MQTRTAQRIRRHARGMTRTLLPTIQKKGKVARVTGLEPATSGVTGRHSNRLSYTRAPGETGNRPAERRGELGASPLTVKRRWRANFGSGNRRRLIVCQALESAVHAFGLQIDFLLRRWREPPKRLAHGGRLAQLVERFVYTEDVGSSSLSSPTTLSNAIETIYSRSSPSLSGVAMCVRGMHFVAERQTGA